MKIHPFKPTLPNKTKIEDFSTFFSKAKSRFLEYDNAGLLKSSKEDHVYIYEIKFNGRLHRGILCCINSNEILNGNVIRHEHTLKEKEELMMQLIKERSANIKPVLLTIPGNKNLSKWVREHGGNESIDYAYGEDEVHTLYPINDENAIKSLKQIFKTEITKAYIADGHHRCFSIRHLIQEDEKKYGKLLTAFFSFDDLIIRPYNRIVKFHKVLSEVKLIEDLGEYMDLKEVDAFEQPTSRKELMMYYHNSWWKAKWKKAYVKEDSESMDLFNTYVIDQVLQNDIESIEYIQGDNSIQSTLKTIHKDNSKIGFYFPAVTFKRLTKLLDRGSVVAPKSTFFEPRMRNALVVQKL